MSRFSNILAPLDIIMCTYTYKFLFLFVFLSGGMMLAADYSQLELRVLAHLSKDQRLLQVSGPEQEKARQTLA